MAAETETLLTTAQVQEKYNVTPMTVYNWRQGKVTGAEDDPLPCRKIPAGKRARVRFDERELEAWVERHKDHLRIGA